MGMIIVYLLEYIWDVFVCNVDESSVIILKECYVLFFCGLKIDIEMELELKFKDVVIDMF